jgi:hypothetical protein
MVIVLLSVVYLVPGKSQERTMWPFKPKKPQVSVPTIEIEEAKRLTGLSERELTRMFIEKLLKEGKNPFADMPPELLRYDQQEFPDLVELARKKFGAPDLLTNTTTQKISSTARTWDNLPSMVMLPVRNGFSFDALSQSIRQQSPDKDLVFLVEEGWAASQSEAMNDIQRLYEFADDAKLVLMRFPGNQRIVIRASFMHETALWVRASTLSGIAFELILEANKRQLNCTTAEDGGAMDTEFRRRIQPRITALVAAFRANHPRAFPNQIANMVEPRLGYRFPPNMPLKEQERVSKEVHELILRECKQ